MIVEPVDSDDQPKVEALLKQVNLPIEGVCDQFQNYFKIQGESDKIIGCVGVEVYGNMGLLRSVAIHPDFQRKGLGKKLVEGAEEFSKTRALKKIYLLTEGAEEFFSRLGYKTIPREQADPSVQQSLEFTTVCKDSGTCMEKDLED